MKGFHFFKGLKTYTNNCYTVPSRVIVREARRRALCAITYDSAYLYQRVNVIITYKDAKNIVK
jgi:hypothetical protein